jgi:hypothetical protein
MPDLSFGSYTLPVYLYEAFSYVISNPVNPSSVEKPITNSPGLAAGLFSDTSSNFTFAGNGNSLTAGSTESFSYVVKDGLGNSYTSSNQVPVGAGRLTDLSGNSVSGNRYEFFKNQPIQRIQMKAPFTLCNSVLSVPTLPPGLQFYTSGSNLDISGTPLVTLPTSNYLIIAKDASSGSKIVTTSNTFVVSNEQILFDLCGSPIITMTVDTPITPRILTAQFPPYPSGGTLKYTWQTFPDGLSVYDVSGNDKTVSNSFGFLTTDPSHVFAVSGTPSLAAAYAYATIPPNPVQRSIQGQRVNPLPTLTSNYPLTFSFTETILFDPVTVPPLYTSNIIDPNSISFRAATYFSSGAGTAISNIFSPDLRSDLSLVFIPSLSRADLSGTPLFAGTADYTIRAINSNGTTRDYTRTFTVSNDSITFSSPVGTDLCYSFILSRPVELSKTGYYPSNIQFRATAASGRSVSLSAPALTGTGLSLNSNGVITGIPSTVTPLSTLSVTATAAGSPASATRDISFSILNDVFTFADISASSLTFIQNVPITPFQVSVTTLSERNILNYSEIGFPSGLSINPAGVVSGTSLGGTSGTVTFGATTGYASGSSNYSYNVTPDSMLFLGPNASYSYTAGQTITPIEIDAFVYSGATVDRFDLSLIPSYGLDVSSTTGTFSGTWTTGIPPDTVLPASCNFTINATAGSFVQSLPVSFTADPVLISRMFFSTFGTNVSGTLCSIPVTDVSAIKLHTSSLSPFSEIQFRTTSALSNDIILATTSGGNTSVPGLVYSASNLNTGALTFNSGTNIDISGANVSSLTLISGSSWRIGGRRQSAIDASAIMYASSDDGQSWTLNSQYVSGLKTRDNGSNFNDNPYLQGGLALRAKDGVLMAGGLGGNAIVRSVDDGATWNSVTGPFTGECAYFNLDHPTIWIATGSRYSSLTTTNPLFTSDTIKYSTDGGQVWTNVASGPFNLHGYEVAYGNNTWLATGVSFDLSGATYLYTPELRTSTNGSNWTRIPFFSDLFSSNQTSNIVKAPLRLGSMAFDGSNWNVFVNVENQSGTTVSIPRLYQHPASGSLLTGWSSIDLSGSFTSIGATVNSNLRVVSMTPPKLVFDEDPPIDITLNFTLGAGTGPTLTSPTTLSFSQYQYIPITPIQLAATGTGTVYFFVPSANLPPGLTFNQFTNQLTGTPASIGNYTMTFYAKDSIGASTFTMSFSFIIPRVIRTQDGAGAYTSLLRQYTTVLGAQNARDQVVLPTQERGLGEFMSPPAPDVITAVIDPRCKNPNC